MGYKLWHISDHLGKVGNNKAFNTIAGTKTFRMNYMVEKEDFSITGE